MRVFVLTTGRTGSVTFARSCGHINNYTVGHETKIGDLCGRLDYPDQHIEVDNRLAWFLGPIAQEYSDVFYLHLTRDRHAVVTSYAQRSFDAPEPKRPPRDRLAMFRGRRHSVFLVDAFSHGLILHRRRLKGDQLEHTAGLMVDTINANVTEFLRDKPHMVIDLADAADKLPEFWEQIGADGDIDAARNEFSVRHNAT